jgi:hypothetical protein
VAARVICGVRLCAVQCETALVGKRTLALLKMHGTTIKNNK